MKLTTSRSVILINNLLSELSDKIPWNSESEYLTWLRTEVGFSEEELDELKEKECLPIPKYF